MSVIQTFDTMSQIEKHEAAELLFLKKAKEQRKAASLLRKQIAVKQEAEVIEISEPSSEALPRDFAPLPQDLFQSEPIILSSVISTPVAVVDSAVPSAPVKKPRKPLTQEHKDAMMAGLKKKRAEKLQEKLQKEQEAKRTLNFLAELDEIIGVPVTNPSVTDAPPAPVAPSTRSPHGNQDSDTLEARKRISQSKISCERMQEINRYLIINNVPIKPANTKKWGYTKASEFDRIARVFGNEVMTTPFANESDLFAFLQSKGYTGTFPEKE